MSRKITFWLLCFTLLCFVCQASVMAEGGYEYEIREDGTICLLWAECWPLRGDSSFALEIPETIDGYVVAELGPGLTGDSLPAKAELSKVVIPKTVICIDPLFLEGTRIAATGAQEGALVQVAEDNPVYTYLYEQGFGCLVERDSMSLVAVLEHRGKNLRIPDGVQEIGRGALRGLSLDSLFLPASLTRLSEGAFLGLERVEDIEIHDDNQNIYADREGIFDGDRETLFYVLDDGRRTWTVPDTVRKIDEGCYAGHENLTRVVLGKGLTSLENPLFDGCSSGLTIVLSDTIAEINPAVFQVEGAKFRLEVSEENPYFTEIDGMLYSRGDVLVCCPWGTAHEKVTIPDGVTAIGQGAFSPLCTSMEIWIPESVTVIDDTGLVQIEDLLIRTVEGSRAQEFAEEQGIACEAESKMGIASKGLGRAIGRIPAPVWIGLGLVLLILVIREATREGGQLRPKFLFGREPQRILGFLSGSSGLLICVAAINSGLGIREMWNEGDILVKYILLLCWIGTPLFILSEVLCSRFWWGIVRVLVKGVLFVIVLMGSIRFSLVLRGAFLGMLFGIIAYTVHAGAMILVALGLTRPMMILAEIFGAAAEGMRERESEEPGPKKEEKSYPIGVRDEKGRTCWIGKGIDGDALFVTTADGETVPVREAWNSFIDSNGRYYYE